RRYETTTDEKGMFVLNDLFPGLYEVLFDAVGFKRTLLTNVTVAVSNSTEVRAVLEPGEVVETVTVTSNAGPGRFATDRSVNAARSSATDQFSVVTKSGDSSITTPHL